MIKQIKNNPTKKYTSQQKLDKGRTIGCVAFNAVIFLLLITGILLVAFKEKNLTGELLKYFTVQSNIVMGTAALVYLVFVILVMFGKLKRIPKPMEIVKLVATTGVVLTFFVVVLFLTPTMPEKRVLLYTNANLIFHVFIPILSALSLLLFEHSSNKYKYSETWFCLIHIILYSIVYMVLALTHLVGGEVQEGYDWYRFIKTFGVYWTPAVFVGMIGVSYLFGWLLWLGNKKINIFNVNLQS